MPLALEIFVFSHFHANWQKKGSKLRKIWSNMRFCLLIGSRQRWRHCKSNKEWLTCNKVTRTLGTRYWRGNRRLTWRKCKLLWKGAISERFFWTSASCFLLFDYRKRPPPTTSDYYYILKSSQSRQSLWWEVCFWYQQKNPLGTKNSPSFCDIYTGALAAVDDAFALAEGIMGSLMPPLQRSLKRDALHATECWALLGVEQCA